MKQTLTLIGHLLVLFIFLSLMFSVGQNVLLSIIPFGIYLTIVYALSQNKTEAYRSKVIYAAFVMVLILVSSVSTFFIWTDLLRGTDFSYRNWILTLFPTMALAVLSYFFVAESKKIPARNMVESSLEETFAGSHLFISFLTASIICSFTLIGLKSLADAFSGMQLLTDKFTARGLIPPLTLFLFYWAVFLYLHRFFRLHKEFGTIDADGVPTDAVGAGSPSSDEPIATEGASETTDTAPYQEIHDGHTPQSAQRQDSTLLKAIRHRLDVLNSDERERFIERTIDEIWIRAKSFYMLPGWINWSIPILGFLGTVLGISMASEGIAGIIQSPEGLGKLASDLGYAIEPLGIAFDTTLISLSLSLVLMLVQTILQKWEEKHLLHLETYIQSLEKFEK